MKQMNNVNIKQGNFNDLDLIYGLMQELFPSNEIKSKKKIASLMSTGKYILYIAEDTQFTDNRKIIGFSFIYVLRKYKSLWLDYFAINKVHQASGYGTWLFEKIIDVTGGNSMSIFLELEIPKNQDTSSPENKRIRFYERFGVKLLDLAYKIPAGKEAIPMYLAVRPDLTNTLPSKKVIKGAIKEIMNNVHDDEETMVASRNEILVKLSKKN